MRAPNGPDAHLAVNRVLDAEPVGSLAAYTSSGGGEGLRAARNMAPDDLVAMVDASGLRGRGGAGFPTGKKWQTSRQYASPTVATTVVVNAAEGEPGSFKDRALMRQNPYRVIEGALVAAHAVDAAEVTIGLKRRFDQSVDRVFAAIDEIDKAGWFEELVVRVVEGPSSYLFGEETGLLEVVAGRQPFPRVAPPWRRGAAEVGEIGDDTTAGTELASPENTTDAPPALVNNVETMAHVPMILANGVDWFREHGTASSPGTVVCTISGDTLTAGVAEFPMGTPLSSVITAIGNGVADGRQVNAVLSGVANPILPAEHLGVPLTHEDFRQAGSGLGATGFLVYDDATDPVAIAAGVSHFLAVESCGQCEPCKADGLALAAALERLAAGEPAGNDLVDLEIRSESVIRGARCNLAHQQQQVIGSLLDLFPDDVLAHGRGDRPAADPVTIAPIVDIVDEAAMLDPEQATKQPDWTQNETDSGEYPVDHLRTVGVDERAP